MNKISAKKRKVTMENVAKEAGVSITTVSLVLHDVSNARISAKTRKTVKKVARELGYIPLNRQILTPSTVTNKIGVIGTFRRFRFLEGVTQAAYENELVPLIIERTENTNLQNFLVEALANQPLAGFIYATPDTMKVEIPTILKKYPLVMANCYTKERDFPFVVPAEVTGGYTATDALIQHNHRRIGFINGDKWMEAAVDRLKGYKMACHSADIPYDDRLCFFSNWSPRDGFEITKKLMLLDEPPTAIFCASDSLAIGCYMALYQLGYEIPKDVSVVGYDNDPLAKYLTPQLTTVRLPLRSMGKWAVEYLLNYANKPACKKHPNIKLECELLEGNSIAPPS